MATQRRKIEWTAEMDALLTKKFLAGETRLSIASTFDVHPTTIGLRVKTLGLTRPRVNPFKKAPPERVDPVAYEVYDPSGDTPRLSAEAQQFKQYPSRRGNLLVYRDGRRERTTHGVA